VVAAAAVATALMPVATSSGEALEQRVGNPGEHAELGDQLIWFAIPLLVLAAAVVFLEWRRAHDRPAGTERLRQVVAALAVVASAAFFLNHRAMPGYDMSDLARMLLLAATAVGTAAMTGLLRQKWIEAFASEQAHHATATRLSAALDQIEIGIVLLDSDTRAEFINRAFRDYFRLPDAQADSKPAFIALMYHGRDTGAWELPEDEMSAFIAKRTELIRAGDSTPINIKLTDGEVLRFTCTALPDGGRMLSYAPVTDLIRYTDDPGSADYFRALRGSPRGLVRHLRAAE
jgi:PAS domain-containing protein